MVVGVSRDTSMDNKLYDDRSVTLFSILMSCLRPKSYKVFFRNLFSMWLKDMNRRRSTARREKEGVANERIPSRVVQVPVVGLEEENEKVPLQELQFLRNPNSLKCPKWLLCLKLLLLREI